VWPLLRGQPDNREEWFPVPLGRFSSKALIALPKSRKVFGLFPVQEGDWVQTGVNSLVLLEVGSGIQVVMNESTAFHLLTRWEVTTDITWIFRLTQGELWVRLLGELIRFEVETVTGTVAMKEANSPDPALGNLYRNPYGVSEGKPSGPLAEFSTVEFDLVVSLEQTTPLTVLVGQVDFGTVFNTWVVPTSMMSSASWGTRCSKTKTVEVQSVLCWAEKMRPLVVQSGGERSGH
jgi:hypothetical protein